jgi:hypothetical protein
VDRGGLLLRGLKPVRGVWMKSGVEELRAGLPRPRFKGGRQTAVLLSLSLSRQRPSRRVRLHVEESRYGRQKQKEDPGEGLMVMICSAIVLK